MCAECNGQAFISSEARCQCVDLRRVVAVDGAGDEGAPLVLSHLRIAIEWAQREGLPKVRIVMLLLPFL